MLVSCHILDAIKTHTLRWSFANIEPMNKLLLLPTILVLVSCQPSELERCVEANILNKITPENKEIILDTYDIVLPETVEQQFKETMIAFFQLQIDGEYDDSPFKANTSLLRYEEWKKFVLENDFTPMLIETGLHDNPKTIADLKESERITLEDIQEYGDSLFKAYYKNLIDYNKEYYGLTDEKILLINATSMCNSQGIY